jgi:hypothetical protein
LVSSVEPRQIARGEGRRGVCIKTSEVADLRWDGGELVAIELKIFEMRERG